MEDPTPETCSVCGGPPSRLFLILKTNRIESYCDEHRPDYVEARAERRLLDAATDLLRACEEARKSIAAANKILTCPAAEYVPAIPESWVKLERAIDVLDAAIAKARGEDK